MAHQTDDAWTRAELADIENEDIKVRYAGKKGPKASRQKMTTAQVANGGFLMKKKTAFQEKEQEMEEKSDSKGCKGPNKGTK